MELKKIKFKAGEISGKTEKEGYYIKIPLGYIEVFIKSSQIIERFKTVVSEKNVNFDKQGKMVVE